MRFCDVTGSVFDRPDRPMSGWLHIASGGSLALLAWLAPRHVAAARTARPPALLLDLFPGLLIGGLLLIATGKPVFTGVALLSLGAGYALADRTKREALREPVVFSEMSEVPHLFSHPQLYLPFAGPSLVIGGAIGTVILCLALLLLEARLWEPEPGVALAYCILVAAMGWIISREPTLPAVAAALRRLRPTGEPFEDASRLGPLAMFLVYGVVARAERPERRTRHSLLAAPAPRQAHFAAAVPLILVQCESFFDARRLSPLIPDDLLSGFDACCRTGAAFGRLEVPAWGANTMRAEF